MKREGNKGGGWQCVREKNQRRGESIKKALERACRPLKGKSLALGGDGGERITRRVGVRVAGEGGGG